MKTIDRKPILMQADDLKVKKTWIASRTITLYQYWREFQKLDCRPINNWRMCTYMNQEKKIDVCAFPVLFIPLIFLRDLILPDPCMCTYVNYYLDYSWPNTHSPPPLCIPIVKKAFPHLYSNLTFEIRFQSHSLATNLFLFNCFKNYA